MRGPCSGQIIMAVQDVCFVRPTQMVRLLESWSVCPGAGRHMVWDSMVPGAGFVRMEGLSVAVREPWGYAPIVITPQSYRGGN